jgi:hypothetical protein
MNDRKSDKSDAPTLPPPPKTEATSEEVTRAGEIPPEIMALLAAKAGGSVQNEVKTVPPPAPRPAAGTGPALASSTIDVDDDGWGSEKAPGSGGGAPVNQSMKTPQAFEVYKPRAPQYDKATPAIPFPPSAPNFPAAAPAAPQAAAPAPAATPIGAGATPSTPTTKTDPLPPSGQAAVQAPVSMGAAPPMTFSEPRIDPKNVRIPKTPAVPHELALARPEALTSPQPSDSLAPALTPARRFDVKFLVAALVVVGILAAVAVWALK